MFLCLIDDVLKDLIDLLHLKT